MLVPQPKSWGDQSPPVPTVVVPMILLQKLSFYKDYKATVIYHGNQTRQDLTRSNNIQSVYTVKHQNQEKQKRQAVEDHLALSTVGQRASEHTDTAPGYEVFPKQIRTYITFINKTMTRDYP